ncbi:hypothetical protein OsI_36537 [Oryza sativa Indica Group]|uniref:Leucine-rich repeat-containing N-terminal plant-type domain-containing protein n=1 Tax=Oryza sativa subsp. indica TaxID=39946 RepID=B8BL51_ORYSI|nr:hypothetical protein OsI_36537 [Oryza sativa Indica Group]
MARSPTSVMISSLLLLLLIGPASSDDDAAAAAARTSTGGVAGDELALLSFKSSLLHQGGLSLASWNTSGHGQHCTWVGVVCGRRRRRHPHRVVKLLLRSSNLSGIISPSLGNLSFLRSWTSATTTSPARYHRSSAVSAGFSCWS